MDAQLPLALARWIAAAGYDACHVHDLGLEAASDSVIWREALSQGRVILTKDEDFVLPRRIAPAPQVVWIRLGNTSKNALLQRIEIVFPQITEALGAGEMVVEVR